MLSNWNVASHQNTNNRPPDRDVFPVPQAACSNVFFHLPTAQCVTGTVGVPLRSPPAIPQPDPIGKCSSHACIPCMHGLF